MATRGERGKTRLVPRIVATLGLLIFGGAVLWGAGLWWSQRGPIDAARQAYVRGDWLAAAQQARERLRANPRDLDAQRLLARASMRMGREEFAQSLYNRIGIDAMQPEDLGLLASSLLRAGNVEAAEMMAKRGIEQEPAHAECLDTLARVLASTDRLEAAADVATRLAAQAGWKARGSVLLGMVHHERGDAAAESAALEAALQHDPALASASRSPAQVRLMLARAYLAQGRPNNARGVLNQITDSEVGGEKEWLLGRTALQEGNLDAAAASMARGASTPPRRPMEREPASLVGAQDCASCHRAIFDAQQSSHHARTFHAGTDLARLATPVGSIADPVAPEITYEFQRGDDGTSFHVRRDGRKARALMEYAFGSDDRGSTPAGRDEAGRWREFRLSHYGAGAEWDLTTGQPQVPPDAASGDPAAYLGRVLDADGLRRCFSCHVTDVRSARDAASPAAADRAIGCERCHGPGKHHALAMQAAPKIPDMAIAAPRLATGAEVTELCATCHSPKGGEVRRDDPTSIRFQGTTLTWSRCFTESNGALSCVSCHDPHRDAETRHDYYDRKCLACHDASRTAAQWAADHDENDGARVIEPREDMRRVACPVNASTGCVECHMPTKGGVIPHTTFTDHFIRVHAEPGKN